jgi:hypothetical protein
MDVNKLVATILAGFMPTRFSFFLAGPNEAFLQQPWVENRKIINNPMKFKH